MENSKFYEYKLKKGHLRNIEPFQINEFLNNSKFDNDGNILIPFRHRGYTCNDKRINYNRPVQALSFFSGCGGLDIGTQMAGVKVLSSLDFNKDSVDSLKRNKYFDHCLHKHENIMDVNGNDFSNIIQKNNPEKLIIVGGPPCQPFSKAGYWVKNENRQSSNDPRNMIAPYFRIISEIKPDGFLLENVESILHPSNQEAIELIDNEMKKLGYNYSLLRINAADYGIPQKRKRVFFLASKKKINAELTRTHGDEKSIIANPQLLPYERVIDWIGLFDEKKYYQNEDVNVSGKWETELTMIPPGKNYIALSEKSGHPNPIFVSGKRYWSSLLKLDPLKPSWTIIANPGHWEGPFHWTNRRLSIRECAALQTFPDDYIFSGSTRSQRTQIGNAVPPLLGQLVVDELCRWI